MEYLIPGLICIVIILLVLLRVNKIRKKKNLEEVRAAWGNPKKEMFDFDLIARYSKGVKETKFHRLTDQTMEDIDFEGLFTFLDRTSSKVGQQFFYHKLVEPTNHTVDPQERLVGLFSSNVLLRENIQLELLKLNNGGAYYISSLLDDKLLEKPTWFNFLFLDVGIVITLIILSFVFPGLSIVLIVPVTLNVFLHYWNKGNAFPFLKSFPQLNNLIQVSKAILKKNEQFSDKEVEKSIQGLRSFQQKVGLINFNQGTGIQSELSFLATYLTEWIKAVFLIEVFTLYRITRELETKKSSIQALFGYIGQIDSALSIASLRAGKEKTCVPSLGSRSKELQAKNVYHPLIIDCVKNDLIVKNKSILITGSNMAGKSTFLRTLIINSILAQTIYTCFAFKTVFFHQN
jgi:hypothetical protein